MNEEPEQCSVSWVDGYRAANESWLARVRNAITALRAKESFYQAEIRRLQKELNAIQKAIAEAPQNESHG